MPVSPAVDRTAAAALLLVIAAIACAPSALAVDPDAPGTDVHPYSVLPASDQLAFHPCSTCHQHLPANPTPRQLAAPHPAELDHGDGRIWCLNCHHPGNRDALVNALGNEVAFDAAPRVCATCHQARYRDWEGGAHGKRASGWQGERQLFGCTHCHDPHAPALKPRAPAPPPVRRIPGGDAEAHAP